MTKEEKELLKNKMKELISTTEKDIVSLEEITQPVSPENSIGRLTRLDAINNKSVAEAALRNNRKKLNQLKYALNRIDDEDYGNCERCKIPIPLQRLLYMPESNRCIHCADR